MTRQQLSETLYLFGLMLLAAAMPLSIFIISIAQFVLLGSWFIGGNIAEKIKTAFSNPAVAILAAVYFMHLVGGFYSTDYEYFYKEVRIKLPLLILPVLIYTSPKLSEKWFERIMCVFVLAVLISSVISMGVLYDIFPHKNPIDDIRNISVFVSHIRLSLFICISIFTAGYFLFKHSHKNNFLKNSLLIVFIAWFVVFLFILEAMTGVLILILTCIVLLIYSVFKQKNILLKSAIVFTAAIIPFAGYWYVKNEAKKIYHPQSIDINTLDKFTINGTSYSHCMECNDQENGNLTWMYFCEPEVTIAWKQRSNLEYAGKDLRGHDLKYTLIRFLTSKGLRKDSAGVFALNENEIHSIENGIANAEYQKLGSLKIRLHKTIMEYYDYKLGKNPTGNSMMQRIEYWKAGRNIFLQNFWTGVGTGDVQKAFDKEYKRVNSPLSEYARHRAHNQYLTFALTFGIAGLLFFLVSLFYPMFKLKMNTDYFYMTFFIIAAISMLTEDTLETQAGVTFFAFFNTFILFARKDSPR